MSDTVALFSTEFETKLTDEASFFKRDSIKEAYLIGAYCKGIIDSSFNPKGKVVSENTTFKKWLSNQSIIQSNLQRIFAKAASFERKFQLDSTRNRDLSTLITTYAKPGNQEVVLQQEISFAFIRGFNDYSQFKQTHKGDEE